MSVQFLVNGVHEDGSPGLVIATEEEWLKIIQENSNLPANQRRYFYKDVIYDEGEADYLIMEVPYKLLLDWNRSGWIKYRNLCEQKKYSHISLDLLTEEGFEGTPDSIDIEDIAINNVFVETLYKAVSSIAHWAPGLLELYLAGKEDESIEYLMNTCHVVRQSANRYRQLFENFIKIFLFS